MRRVVRLLQVHGEGLLGSGSADGFDESQMLQELAGYVLEKPSVPLPPGMIRAWGYLVVMTGAIGKSEMGMGLPMQRSFDEAHYEPLELRPIGRLVPLAAPQPEPNAPPTVRSLRPVRSGQVYRISSPPLRGLVRPELAEALETVFERFARERGFTPEKPLEIRVARGFKAGSHGHGEGQAVDISAVGGKSLLEWKQQWDQAVASAEELSDPQQRVEAIAAEQKRNLGYGL